MEIAMRRLGDYCRRRVVEKINNLNFSSLTYISSSNLRGRL